MYVCIYVYIYIYIYIYSRIISYRFTCTLARGPPTLRPRRLSRLLYRIMS